MDKKQLLTNAVLMVAIAPPLQESEGLLGIPWWVWLVVIVILLVLLLVGLVLKQEPGPPIENQSPKPYPVAKPAVPAITVEPEPVTAESGRMPEVQSLEVEAEVAAEEELAPLQPVVQPESEIDVTTVADDLRRIEGIGPKIADLLQTAGIRTFAELAATDPARLREILAESELQMTDPSSWPEQARLAAEGNWDEFKKLTDSLKGGRRAL